MKNILVTGYAAHELGIFNQKHKALKYIRKACIKKMIDLVDNGAEWFISPGQYGFDLWAAEIAMKLRDTQFPHIKVSVIHAYTNQTNKWNEEKQQYWNKLRQKLDYYDVVSKQDYNGIWQLQARDNLLIQKSDAMLIFYDGEAAESKSRYMIQKAEHKLNEADYNIYYITADDIQQQVEEELDNNYSE